jgi:hypothetical protein
VTDVQPDLPVHDVGDVPVHDMPSLSDPGPLSDTVEIGPSRAGGLLALGVAGVVTVAAIVLLADGADGHRSATPTPLPLPVVTTALSPTPPGVVAVTPAAPAAALVPRGNTCFDVEPGRGGLISVYIRNRLAHDVVVQRVSFAPQPGVTVAATSVVIGHPLATTCPVSRDLHPAAHYRVAPGPAWISARLTRTPPCGTALRSAWLVSFTDRGRTHQVRLSGISIAPICAPRPHFSHGRTG